MNRHEITALISAMREKYMMLHIQEIGEIDLIQEFKEDLLEELVRAEM